MVNLTKSHSLSSNTQGIGRGVKLCGQNEIASQTLVCFLDSGKGFHYGFGYKNGSNNRVACWEGNERQNKTVPSGVSIIAFTKETCGVSFEKVSEKHFEKVTKWFNDDKQQNVKNDLVALNKKDKVHDLSGGLADLKIQ